MPISTSGNELCKVDIKTFSDLNIDISKIVSVKPDWEQNMVGKNVGFLKLFTETINHSLVPFRCIILQEMFSPNRDCQNYMI